MSELARVIPRMRGLASEPRRQPLPSEPVCATFRRFLHERGLRFTSERALILDAVLRHEGHFEPEHLVADLRRAGRRASRATVYRTLAHLQDAGIVKQAMVENKRTYYEVIAGRQAHDHLICVLTGKVVEFTSPRLRKLRDEICREHGFAPVAHRFQIFGISPDGMAQRNKR